MAVTLSEILNARENRARTQKSLLSRGFPIISFSMNIAGPVKLSPSIERAFSEGRRQLEEELPPDCVRYIYNDISPTGCEAIYCIDAKASDIKDICVKIEEGSRLGRLFDLDVIDTNGNKLERGLPRECLICGKRGRECAASRAHSVELLQRETAKIIRNYFKQKDAKRFASLAKSSLLRELYTTPKPGLVDKRNNGSHPDMSIEVFERSAHALEPYFYDCFILGSDGGACSQEEFLRLRALGIEAEEQMLLATDGVNTHKGAIFCFGIILYSLGALWREDAAIPSTSELLSACASVAEHSLSDLFDGKTETAGKRLFAEKKITGVRGEAANGFPSVKNIALPCYEGALDASFSQNDAGVLTLLALIAKIDDTTLYKRGGDEGVAFAKHSARAILEKRKGQDNYAPSDLIDDVESLDREFISHNLSVGGCADLLAVCYFLHELKSSAF